MVLCFGGGAAAPAPHPRPSPSLPTTDHLLQRRPFHEPARARPLRFLFFPHPLPPTPFLSAHLSSPLPLPSPPLLPATTCLFPFLVWAPAWADVEMMLGGLGPPDVIRLRFSQAADDGARFHSGEEAGQLSDLLGDSMLQLNRATQRVNSEWYPVALDVLLKKFSGSGGDKVDVQKFFGYIGLFTLLGFWWLVWPLNAVGIEPQFTIPHSTSLAEVFAGFVLANLSDNHFCKEDES
ncbi:hypothetical protein RHGRI_005733 [Rhododendron griersonianum]|uniref:Uncharacterized protein n=1 Tax=Rhododendron griersonianum TaxID=479676 RepID=A0AAV6LED7_9ERIC|nr:hypothetical protein RHGRI_005733 [Rhododendron griersonianum]